MAASCYTSLRILFPKQLSRLAAPSHLNRVFIFTPVLKTHEMLTSDQLPVFLRGHTTFRSACSITYSRSSDLGHDKSLIYFLATLQQFGVDILPITWQPALDELGFGASAHVNQSIINVQSSLAFKRIASNTSYKALLLEVIISSTPKVRGHPNVNALEGVCWEVRAQSLGKLFDAVPVLVYQKASFGNLRDLMRNKIGQRLSFALKLQICLDIAMALETLHSCCTIEISFYPLPGF